MDKKAIKNFAIEARKSLISGVSTKLSKLGITENGIEEATRIDNDLIEIQSTGARFSGKEVASRAKLVTEFQKREIQGQKYELAFETLIEEVAYTWFNRIIAIRFMEVNDYLPDRLRVLSSETSGKKEPDVITALLDTGLYEALDHESKERVTELLTDGSADAVDELYQLVFIKQCNSLNAQLPDLFERIEDYTELLITISYIDENGVIASLLTIPESDFDVRQEGQIEIIGWMYQYYNTEPKDKVFARGSRKIRADEIPAATQLFTPDWIVRYMVENSLGRYYIDQKLANPLEERSEKEIADAFGWKYYLPTAGQPEDVQLQIQDERKKKSVFALQELKLLDNAMGSGHILVYAFDVFIELYKAEGYSEREAAELTMTHNLFGLEIDKRAYQLAYFAIMMKGHQYNRRIFSKNVKLNLHHFVNSDNIPDEYFERLEEFSELSKPVFTSKLANFKAKIGVFKHANEIGSVLNLTDIKRENIENLRQFINVFDEFTNTDILYALPETHKQINDVLDVMEIMATKYEAIVTNPPYLNKMSATLDKYVKDTYPDVKTDLFSVFIKMNSNLLVKGGYAGFMTPFVWMFIKSYEELRNFLIANKSISSLIQMEYSAFEEATVPVCCFTVKNARTEKVGNYFKLSDFRGGMKVQEEKVLEAIQDSSLDYFYQADQTNFQKIPGSPISYWVSEIIFSTFANIMPLGELEKAGTGLQTSNGNRFLRFWYEIDTGMINKKWYHLAKGGSYRKWYGNNEYVVNWENNGSEIKESIVTRYPYLRGNYSLVVKNEKKYFASGVITSRVTSGKLSFRFSPNDEIFSDATTGIFPIHNHLFYLGLLNSPILTLITELNPTLNFQAGDLEKLPLILPKTVVDFEKKVQILITISKIDWDSFEESWDFKKHPLI